ncbi:MAG: outer membrane protein [Terracidiphilus sp.]
MRRKLSSVLLAAVIAGAFAVPRLAAQVTDSAQARVRFPLSVAITYDATLANSITGKAFWMQGGHAQFCGDFYRGWGAVADVGGMSINNANSSGSSVGIVTATFGPRYTWTPRHSRTAFYGEGLAGVANGFNGIYPLPGGVQTSATSLAVQVGGGLDVHITPRVALRAFQADWLRTELPNSTTNVQNNVRLGAGIVFRIR